MTPSERRTVCLKLLAQLDQQIAECEMLAAEPILADDERECVAVNLECRLKSRERVEELLENLVRCPLTRTVRKLARVEIVATQECGAVGHGQLPCPLQFDDREEWCLSCIAKQAFSQYMIA